MKEWQRAMNVQLAWEAVVAFAGVFLLMYGGWRSDYPVAVVGSVLSAVEIFRLGSGQWLAPVKRLRELR